MCFLIFHTTKLAKTEFVAHRRPIGIDLVVNLFDLIQRRPSET